ncbi:hypothetical protein [Neorhizobium galegae]|uniref:Uncharacterized protein n=1 Tax=Neorhizobium galegae bv. orientalis str. HAMBI 540 TaxID=1028800 RepID=A0A068SM35_NEOGA|nr:hypothetical protein [Neorhizobium galegae]CDN46811.1 Hypothetical protein RG540_CH06210 [Neorhizobium galegae bv. orientalis str. HAMBI 540]
MSNMFTSKNPAGVAVAQTSAIFGVLAMGAVNAHMSGLAAARAARESTNSHVLRHQLGQAINYAESIMQVAEGQAAEIERLKAENARLRTAARTSYESARRLAQRAA